MGERDESPPERISTVAFLGPNGTYTHQAALQRFSGRDYRLIPTETIDDVFTAVREGNVDIGVVPFENSSNGSVANTLDNFADPENSGIVATDEVYQPVRHCLLGRIAKDAPAPAPAPTTTDVISPEIKSTDGDSPIEPGQTVRAQAAKPRVTPLHDITHVKKVYSHPQAWGQCKSFLSTYLKSVEKNDASSTSKAAELASQDPTGTSAAISSKPAAAINNLDILAEGIEDREGNSTRFLCLRLWSEAESAHSRTNVAAAAEMESYKTMVMFTVDHKEAGALANSLAAFKKYGLNLTSINTRPTGETPWHYTFFVEHIGRKRCEGNGGQVNYALEELSKVVSSYRWLGSWSKTADGSSSPGDLPSKSAQNHECTHELADEGTKRLSQ